MFVFQIEEDTANYMQYKIMNLERNHKTVLRLKKGTLPHKFQCQKYSEPQPSSANKKRKLSETIEEALSSPPAKQSVSTPTLNELSQIDIEIEATTSTSQVQTEDIEMINLYEAVCSTLLSTQNKMYDDKAVHVNIKVYYRCKGVPVNLRPKKKNSCIYISHFK